MHAKEKTLKVRNCVDGSCACVCAYVWGKIPSLRRRYIPPPIQGDASWYWHTRDKRDSGKHPPVISCRNWRSYVRITHTFFPWHLNQLKRLMTASYWNISSCTITKVKQHQLWSVPRWVTAWVFTRLYKRECAGGAVDSDSELLIKAQSSISSCIHYVHLYANTLGKGMNSPPSYGLITKTCITKSLPQKKKVLMV